LGLREDATIPLMMSQCSPHSFEITNSSTFSHISSAPPASHSISNRPPRAFEASSAARMDMLFPRKTRIDLMVVGSEDGTPVESK
jgi:hypothetical protein